MSRDTPLPLCILWLLFHPDNKTAIINTEITTHPHQTQEHKCACVNPRLNPTINWQSKCTPQSNKYILHACGSNSEHLIQLQNGIAHAHKAVCSCHTCRKQNHPTRHKNTTSWPKKSEITFLGRYCVCFGKTTNPISKLHATSELTQSLKRNQDRRCNISSRKRLKLLPTHAKRPGAITGPLHQSGFWGTEHMSWMNAHSQATTKDRW